MTLHLTLTRLQNIILGATIGLLTFVLPSCHKEAPLRTKVIGDIQDLHVKLHDNATDSVGLWLDELVLIQKQFPISDSLAAQTYYYRGRHLYQLGQLDSAATLFHQAISLIRPPITGRQTDYFSMAWSAYSALGEYGECIALSNTLESLLGIDSKPWQKALLYFIRENAYLQQGDSIQAMEYNTRYIEQLELGRDTQSLASALISKAFYIYYVDKDVDRTFAILDTLVENEHQYSDNTNRRIHGDYGVYLFMKGNYQSALASYKKGLAKVHKMSNEPEQDEFLATAYYNIAEAYMELDNAESAQLYMDSIYHLGLNSISENIRSSTLRNQLKLVYNDRQGLEPVMNALDRILLYQNQQFLQRNQSELKALQLANEKEKALLERNKQEELKNLRLRLWQILLLITFVIVLWIGYLLYRQRQLRFEKQELQLHQRLLRTQMNPHFTFNTLYAIQTLIKKDPQKAITYQLKFSRLLRLILENSTANFVLLDDELIAIEQYLELQLLRFPEKFKYEILLEGLERNSLTFIPPMLIQPMIENCIEHGFAGIDYTGLISIRLSVYKDNLLSCSVEDNGLGIQTDEYRSRQAKSTEIINAFLKKLTPRGLTVTDKAARKSGENGVLVEFLIPRKTTTNG